MRFPWVSRERLEEAIRIRDTIIDKLQAQVTELTTERKLQSDFIAVRSNNASIYGLIKPAHEEADEEPKEEIEAAPPSRARQFARSVERKNEEHHRAELAESQRLLDDVIAEGHKAAEAKSPQHWES